MCFRHLITVIPSNTPVLCLYGALRNIDVDIFIEVGPGKVLAGLNKRIDKEIKSYSLSDYNVISEIDLE